MKALYIILALVLISFTPPVKKLKAPPQFFTIAYFEDYIGNTSIQIRNAFKDSNSYYKLMTKKELIANGYEHYYLPGSDSFIKEDIVNGYLIDTWFIIVSYTKSSKYTKCHAVQWASHNTRFYNYTRELESEDYTITNEDITVRDREVIYKYRKPGRIVTIITQRRGTHMTITLAID